MKSRAGAKPSGSGIPPEHLKRLLSFVHPDPHTILGAHLTKAGVVVRAFRPEATGITLLREGKPPLPMKSIDAAGLFEVKIPRLKSVFAYRLEVEYAGDKRFTIRDPYAFLPTVGELDLHLFGEGQHERLWEKLGSHPRTIDGVSGVSFAVWAPGARGVSVVGDFNRWDGRLHAMRSLGKSGIWEIFLPDVGEGAVYKYEIRTALGPIPLKADPYAQRTEVPPANGSIVFARKYRFTDDEWVRARNARPLLAQPISIYEVHPGSWRRVPAEGNRPLTWRELAVALGDYVTETGFTHIQLMPVAEHPFSGSWGYQVTGYFAPTSRFGTPDDFRWFVDHLHSRGIGVLADWVPAHFPKDAWALGRFTGEAVYEHLDPRKGEHPDWGTYIFNFGRHEVKNFLVGNALFWLDEFHLDGLRVDAVASLLYLDYSRKEGEWIPNKFGGRENMEAIALLRETNEKAHRDQPGVLMIAEESTAWGGVSRPTYAGGLGFGYKWNMGWMHDTLHYFEMDPIHRKYHHRNLTFGLLYAWSENFVLPLSHDEVVYGKKSLLGKMPGDRWQKFASLRALYGYMWAHPGKKLLFMGGEIAQGTEWNHESSIDWHLLDEADHAGVKALIRDLNTIYRKHAPLWESDHESAGFDWLDADDADENVLAFRRISPSTGKEVVCVCNFAPVPRTAYRLALPRVGTWKEILNSDAKVYGGTGMGNTGVVVAEPVPHRGKAWSASVTLPPLSTLWLESP